MAENSNKGLLTFIILLIIVIVIGAAAYYMNGGEAMDNGLVMDDSPSGYHAVFLANNQVYFGNLASTKGDFVVLEDIYYLQVNQVLQPIQGEDGQVTQKEVQDIQLVKLGGELHGPTDQMNINKNQILLIESLKDDSNVVGAINEFKKTQDAEGEAAAPAAAPAPAPAPAAAPVQ